MYLSLWHISVAQTFYINFAITFRTNPVLSYDDVNCNNFAETQVCAKISSFFQNGYPCVCVWYLYFEDKM